MLFVFIIIFSLLQSASVKSYNKRNGNAAAFNVLKSLSAFLCMFVCGIVGFQFHTPTLLYGALFGLLLTVSMYSGYKALSLGPLSLTSLLSSFSVIIPICYGIVFCKEGLTLFKSLGFIFMITAMVLSSLGKKSKAEYDYKKWVIYISLTFVSNGFCSVLQKMHQIAYPGKYSLEFMIVAMAVCFVIFLLLGIPSVVKRKNEVQASKKERVLAVFFGILAGISCGMMNLLTIMLAGKENASVMYPMISVGTILAAICYGTIALKEKLSKSQIAALLSGIVSVVFLKL